MCAFYNRLSRVVKLDYLYILNGLSKMLPGCYCINISSQFDKREGINKIFLKICNYVRYYHLVDGNITVLEQYISKVALMSQNIYGTPVFFNFHLYNIQSTLGVQLLTHSQVTRGSTVV